MSIWAAVSEEGCSRRRSMEKNILNKMSKFPYFLEAAKGRSELVHAPLVGTALVVHDESVDLLPELVDLGL